MFSRKLAIVATVAMAITTAPVAAQSQAPTAAPPPQSRSAIEQESGSDLLLILAVMVGAGLLTFLATQIGNNDFDLPASP